MTDTFVLRVAQEELAYLLRALKIMTLPGLEEPALGKLDADHQALALALADRSLRAHQVVSWEGEERRQINPVVASLLRAYAASPCMLSIIAGIPEGKTAYYPRQIYLTAIGQKSLIEQSIPEPGVYQFILLEKLPEALAHFSSRLLLNQETREEREPRQEAPLRLKREELVQTLTPERGQNGERARPEEFSPPQSGTPAASNKMESGYRSIFEIALRTGKAETVIHEEPLERFTLLHGTTAIWLVQADPDDSTTLDLLLISPQQVRAKIAALVQTALSYRHFDDSDIDEK